MALKSERIGCKWPETPEKAIARWLREHPYCQSPRDVQFVPCAEVHKGDYGSTTCFIVIYNAPDDTPFRGDVSASEK
ncbi:MAG TPA: hypothetical protein VFQ60_03390 [Patescibacteria group bacterium]|nr:hypothetical protein [Patescibacteria group bacterium]